MRSFLSFTGIIFLAFSLSFAQQGYTLQVAAYSTPVPTDHFKALPLSIVQIVDTLPTGEPFHLYVVDGFTTYAAVEKARKEAVINGFADAMTVRANQSRHIPQLQILSATSVAPGQLTPSPTGGGYSLQVVTFAAPAPLRYFSDLDLPLRQVTGMLPTGLPFYLYVVDGFATYADADRARKGVVSYGFTDAIALKTSSSRKPAMRVLPYKGPTGDDPVPNAGEIPANQPAPARISEKR